jgi:hypothetical protein
LGCWLGKAENRHESARQGAQGVTTGRLALRKTPCYNNISVINTRAP